MNDETNDETNPEINDEINDEELFHEQMESELETMNMNQLHDLANQAVKQGLILGHGYRGGQYELLRREEVVLLPPNEAVAYLEGLIQNVGS